MKLFIKADLAQAEDRAVAWLAGEETLKQLYTEGVDTHAYKAAMAFGKHIEDVTKDERSLIKPVAHGWNYGRGPKSIADELGMSQAKVIELIQKLKTKFSAIPAWHLKVQQQLRKNRMLVTPFGRKRIFGARWGDGLFREAYAFVPQSTVADYTNLALLRMCALFHEVGYSYNDAVLDTIRQQYQHEIAECMGHVEIVHQCHDEILSLVDKSVTLLYIKVLSAVIEQPFWCETGMLRIPVDIKVGKTWKDCFESCIGCRFWEGCLRLDEPSESVWKDTQAIVGDD